jgi:C-terminal processing protease CtpA/Prc
MKKRIFSWLSILTAISMVTIACAFSIPSNTTQGPAGTNASGAGDQGNQPYEITGEFDYTNSIITTYYVEQAVALVDMYGFVKRDREWEIPVASQTLGYLALDSQKKHGSYTLQLPARPTGQMVDVDNNGQKNTGVQIFAVSYWPNLTGGPYSVADDASKGWPTYLASVITDTENEDEVIGGNLVVWAPDANQEFPTGFGADGKLFTADDPVGILPAGYSIVNLDKEPFTVTQQPEPSLALYEPKDIAIKDYSKDSYTHAFDKMFEIVRKEYAFNGIEGKQPNWDSLYAELQPRVEAAEKNKDPKAFYDVLQDFALAFKDGHVGLDGGNVGTQEFLDATAGGYGFAIRELDDGSVIVTYVLAGSPVAQAGMQVGAQVTAFNGQPIKDAISNVKPWTPQSTEMSYRYQQSRYLLRAPVGTKASVTFSNPDGQSQTLNLAAIAERQSFGVTSIFAGSDPNALPVEYKILNSGVGYVKINSNYDDLNLIIRLFERALTTFQNNKVTGIIIDLRQNSGGAPLGLAGFLTQNEITMGQLEYYSNKTGEFEPEGLPDKITPNQEQYHFDKEVLLVGQACASACELEAYGFSKVPGMIVVGQNPTSGTEAEVARGQFILPEGMSMQIPTGRFILPDGSIFLEGKGVAPTLRVPVDAKTVLSNEDVVLKAGEQAVLQPQGAGIEPSGPPKMMDKSAAEAALSGGAKFLEQLARENYSDADYAQPGTLTFTVQASQSDKLIWGGIWCASTKEVLADNLKSIQYKFVLDGKDVPSDQMAVFETPSQNLFCHLIYTALSDWPAGEHHLSTTMTMTKKVNDGQTDYLPGDYVLDYSVFVTP